MIQANIQLSYTDFSNEVQITSNQSMHFSMSTTMSLAQS